MKQKVGILFLLFGIVSIASGTATLQFSAPYSEGIASNFANSSGVVTNGMRWGIIVDTGNNGFANSATNYDAFAPGVVTAGFLSVGGTATDDYYIPGGLTEDGSGALEGDFTTPGGPGAIGEDLVITLTGGVSMGKPFAVVWFSNNTSADGSRYGFLADGSFVLPADSSIGSFSSFFAGVDPIRSATKTLGVVAATSKLAVFDGSGTGGNARTDNTGVYTFANAVNGTTGNSQTFTLQNTGGANLTSISVSKAATGNPGDFTLNTTGTAISLTPNSTTTFTVTFAPSAVGARSAVIQIASNDVTQNPFRINVSGTSTVATSPSIAVFDGSGVAGNPRPDNAAAYVFASTLVGTNSSTQTFTVQNNGTADLHGLAAAIVPADDFVLVTGGLTSTLAPNATASFTVTFAPGTAGTRNAVVTLTSTEAPDYRVNVSGHGAATQDSRIGVFKGSASGTELASGVSAVAFPTTLPSASSAAQTFTIQNVGVADLTSIAVTKGVAGNPEDFVLSAGSVAATLTPGATTTFTVTFSPTVVGARTAVIQIASSDASDNPFIINLTGQTHTVSFDQDTLRHMEIAETVTLPVHLSSAFSAAFTVPVTFNTNPANLSYTHTPASVLSFAANQLEAKVTLTLKDNLIIEGDKTLTVSLGTPSVAGVVRGAHPATTLTVWDNDTAPVINPVPTNKIVAAGHAVVWVSGATGSDPLTLQWKKNNVVIAGDNAKTGTLNLTSSATLADAGTYSLTATNKRSTVTKSAYLDVVDQTATKVRFDIDGTATLTAVTAGTGMTYQWYRKNGANPASPILNSATKYANATTKTLTIKKLVAGDAGDYFCKVSGPTLPAPAAGSVDSGVVTLQVPTVKPPSVSVVFPDCVAYNTYPNFQIPFSDAAGSDVPTKFVCKGLPTGLVCNAVTGVVSGKPTKAGLNQPVTVTLSNKNGPVDIVTSINIIAFPTPGVCVGLVERHDATNAGIGGRLDLSPTVTGSFTGTLKLGATSYPLSGALLTASAADSHPTVTLTLKRTGTPVPLPLVLTLDLNPTNDEVTGTVGVQGDASKATITGWRNKWVAVSHPVGSNQTGLHSFKLQLDTASAAMSDVPKGYGYGTVNVTTAGVTTIVGRTSDGGVITSSNGVLSASGKVLVYQPLYVGNRGSIAGNLEITADTNHTIASHLDWVKLATTATGGYGRDYATFGLIGVDATGGKYTVSAPVAGFGVTAVGVNNAQLVFTDGGIGLASVNPNVSLRISDKNVAAFPPIISGNNPGKITALTLAPTTGAFSGKFTLADGVTTRSSSVIPFQGQIVTTEGKGFGYFLLPQLVSPPTKTTSSPILSGAVVLQGLVP